MIGRVLGGRYEVLGPLGEGGMALIYRGRRRDDGRAVAIKVLRDQYAHNAEFVARFEREAQAVARLSHPHMVQVYDWGRDGDVHYIVMEFVEGEDLKTLVRRAGRVNEVRAREIAEEVCDALQYAHTQGIVHRDIKPQNILIARDGQVKVTDFGIARALASTTITETGTVLGSVQYLSPEQARGFGVGHTADLYSLGVVLYEMVTGTLPFDGDTPITIALKHMQEPVPAPRCDGRPLTPSMEGIILKALAKAPEVRYRTAGEMRSDLLGETEYWRTRGPDVELTSVVRPRAGAAGPSARAAVPFVAAAIVLLGIFVGLAAAWHALNAYLNVPEVQTPNLVGQTLPEAQAAARQHRLDVQVVQQTHSATVPAGWVVSQDPPAGQTVKVNRVIALTTSLGPVMLSVPDVRRRSLEEARFTIEASQLVVGELREAYNDAVPSGFIVSQDPAPGASIERGATVNLTISKGTAVVLLPDLVGMPLDQARRTLQDLGVTLREVIQEPRDDVPPGQIVAMTPAAGTQIQHGDAVGVTIAVRPTSNGTQAPPPQPIVTATPPQPAPVSASSDAGRRIAHVNLVVPAGPPHQLVKIVVIDQQGVHVVYQGNRSPGENIEQDVTGVGYTVVQVYIDDRLIQEIRP